jgi:hypothetical protein
LHPFD